ncbi:glycosyltransferase, partial [Candidatus Uhrbacteria bacterium]|nr:glycosyltransferase [Candidatus Uhrbacteria bacterium]MBD3284377.1 glycosyltransferase [Candidatus Uhrbacteria bacterium]
MPKLSIIIPTLNEEEGLPSTFDAIDAQTLNDLEVIVADSFETTDRTKEVAKARGARIAPGGKVGPGRNRGAEHALSSILLFLDADTIFPSPEFLEKAVKEIEERELQVAAPDVLPLTKRWLDKMLFRLYNVYVRLLMQIFPHAPGFCLFATREAHDAIGGFDVEVPFAEDHD